MMNSKVKLTSQSADETIQLGMKIGKKIKKGDILLLSAHLGAGKTTLVQGLIKGAGMKETVLSPTFIIAQTFKGRIPIHHLDFYRLTKKEIWEAGVQDYLMGEGEIQKGVVVIEWPERCKSIWPKDRLEVQMKIKPKSKTRDIVIKAKGKRYEKLVHELHSH